jgi:hypothetical protein
MNQINLAQNLNLGSRFIDLWKRVPSCDPPCVTLLDQTMHEEPALLRHQHDVAWNQRMGGSGLDTQNVARPDRRQHAGSLSLQAYGVACAENFRGKLKFVVLSRLHHDRHVRVKLRILTIETALKLGGAHFAAGQGHGFKNPFVSEFRFLIWFFPRTAGAFLLIRIRVFLHRSPRVLDRLWGAARVPPEEYVLRQSTTTKIRNGLGLLVPDPPFLVLSALSRSANLGAQLANILLTCLLL